MKWLILLGLVMPALAREMESYVIGGTPATAGQFPHQLSLRVTNSHSCGASIVNGLEAVCAAHCVGGAVASYSVLGGTIDRTVTNCATCALRSVSSVVAHPDYVDSGARGFPNDISLVKFPNIAQNAQISYIAMTATNGPDYAGLRCTISGWGQTQSIGGLPTILQWADMTVMTNTACENVWGAVSINDGHICLTDADSSACSGDSGGPLVCNGVLAGATSWGSSNCSPSNPSVYSRISFFRAWIDAN